MVSDRHGERSTIIKNLPLTSGMVMHTFKKNHRTWEGGVDRFFECKASLVCVVSSRTAKAK